MMEQDHKIAVEALGAPAYVPYTIGGNKGIKEEERDREAKVEAEAVVDVKLQGKPRQTDDFWASLKEEEVSPRSPSPARSHSSPRSPSSRHDTDDKSAIPLHVKEEIMFAASENGNGDGNGNGYIRSRPSLSRNGSTSGTSSPRKVAFAGTSSAASGRGRKERDVVPIQRPLIDDLPTAWDAAHETYDVLEACVYETKRMGLSREQDEMMVCDCTFDRRDPDAHQCGPNSDCVNRAIFIECLPDECRAKHQCQNQRFAKREFANVEIVQTEKKGFGLRAAEDLPNGTLIYEYIGEVVAEQSFRKRMLQYGQEGIKHFYFMMLQKEEYIDATKKGGIGRFANHSCNPNCEVQKWVVGRRLRMGIFSKRAIQRGEEITFNYNVDRYGHDAQICYCGEPNCVGTIGGKTQTDIAGLDDLFIDALGIGAQVEAEGMKGNKKKKSRQLGEDFIPDLKPITNTEEASKVAAAIRQSADKIRMMGFLLQRVQMTHDKLVHRQFVRAHGFSLMTRILTEMADERQIVLLALQSMAHWQLQYKNKVLDSNVEGPVEGLAKGSDEELAVAAKELIKYWSSLGTEDKITRVNSSSLDAQDDAQTRTIAEAQPYAYPQTRGPAEWENTERTEFKIAPIRPRVPVPSFVRPPPAPIPTPVKPVPTRNDTARVQDYIASIAAAAAAKPAHLASATPSSQSPAESSLSRSPLDEDERRKRAKLYHGSANVSFGASVNANGPSAYELALQEEEEARKHKQLTRLVGDHVTECMKKYRDVMDRETWKRYAKECTEILVEKEKRGSTYSTSRHPSLSDDKKAKMKAFTKEFTHKVMKRLKDKGKLRKVRSSKSKLSTSHSIGDHSSTATGSGPNETNGHANANRDADLDMDSKETEEANAEYEADLDDMFGKADPATMGNEGGLHVDADGGGNASNGGQGDRSESTSTATGRADSTARRPSLGGNTSPAKMVVVDAWQPGVPSAT